MKNRKPSKRQRPDPIQPSPRSNASPAAESVAESLHSAVRRRAAELDRGATRVREDPIPEVRLATAERFRGFLEWLLARCLGELAPPLQGPAFMGESERRLILGTANAIGRELLGDASPDPNGCVVVRLVLDRCDGARCCGQGDEGAPGTCPGPDGGARLPGEIGHLCIGGAPRP